MPLPFDATLKDIVRTHLRDFEEQLRLPGPPATGVLNVDLSTVSAATDVALAHGDPPVCVSDLNFQAGRAADLLARLLLYNALLHHRYGVPVHSVVILLRPAADDPRLTGRLVLRAGPRRGKVDFTYAVVRLWRRPVRRFLRGGLGTLPLAVLAQTPAGVQPRDALADVIRRMDERLRREAQPEEARRLMSAAFILTGLIMPREEARDLYQGVLRMRESSTYQYIMDEGRAEEARKILLRLGRKHHGEPSPAVEATLQAVTDLDRLERMIDHVQGVSSWQDLLQTP